MADTDLARIRQVEAEILARTPEHDLTPTLDRIAAVVELMGHPQRTFPVIHVTGTNGKTSTTRMIERLLREFGLRTGRFTSPHLHDIRERIAFDGEPISPEKFVEAYDEVAPYLATVDARSAAAGQPLLSYFEVLVAMAYAAFADAPVDVAVVEVGLGGEWDATNVADGQVSVVTPIALDHERFLGSTTVEIATEKAGIIKPGRFAVIAQQDVEVAEVLLEKAASVGATVAREGLEFGVLSREVALGGQQLTLRGLGGDYEELFLPLHGAHQAGNAACALAAVEAFLGAGERTLEPRAGAGCVRRPELARPARGRRGAARPSWSTPPTTRPARRRWSTPSTRRSASSGWSASSPSWPTRTPAACSRSSSRSSTRSSSPARHRPARSTPRTWEALRCRCSGPTGCTWRATCPTRSTWP